MCPENDDQYVVNNDVKIFMKGSQRMICDSKLLVKKRDVVLCPQKNMKVICTSIPLHVQIKLETK